MEPASSDFNLQFASNSESIFYKIWESSADGMRLTDTSGNMVFVNNAFCKMVGKDKSFLIGQPLNIIYSKENREKFLLDKPISQPTKITPTIK